MSDEEGESATPRQSRRVPLRQNRRSSVKQNNATSSPRLGTNDDEAEKSARRLGRQSVTKKRQGKENVQTSMHDEEGDYNPADDLSSRAPSKTSKNRKSIAVDRAKKPDGPRHSLTDGRQGIAPQGTLATAASATYVQGTKVSTPTTVGGAIQTPQVPRKVMDDNFEEWMKLATDNVSLGELGSACTVLKRKCCHFHAMHRKSRQTTLGTLP